MPQSKKSSHIGAGILVGTLVGIAAGFYLKSEEGKMVMKDAEKKAKELQGKLMKNLKDVKHLSKEKYEEMVNTTMDYYMKSKDIAQNDLPEVREFLMKKWKEVQNQMMNEERPAIQAAAKKTAKKTKK